MNETKRPGSLILAAMAILITIGLAKLPGALSAGLQKPESTACGDFSGPLTPEDRSQGVKGKAPKGIPYNPFLFPINDKRSAFAGFSLSSAADPEIWAPMLGASWYLDWGVKMQRNFQAPEHWQMVRLAEGCSTPSLDEAAWLALHFPGQVWIIGNEPDVIWQDNLKPEMYARYYHDYYHAIKAADASAQVAVAGVAQGTPLRLAYLDRVLAAYEELYGEKLPADWWTVHGFVLREERGSWGVEIPPGFDEVQAGRLYEVSDHGRLDIFAEQIASFRRWMADNGYRDTPLAVTEFGILMPAEYGFPPETVGWYLWDAFQYLFSERDSQTGYPADGNHLVQRAAWFSLVDSLYPSSNLADLSRMQLTPAGLRFQSFTAGAVLIP